MVNSERSRQPVQMDFGAGPFLTDPADPSSQRRRSTWCFVMTLCFSRHRYVEFVFDQTVMAWLACHRRAFEWFPRVPDRVIIDNAKCAITRVCVRDPIVQRVCLRSLPSVFVPIHSAFIS